MTENEEKQFRDWYLTAEGEIKLPIKGVRELAGVLKKAYIAGMVVGSKFVESERQAKSKV